VAGQKFTRIPKVQYLVSQGVPHYVIPTLCALSDYMGNRSLECFPKMGTLADTLGISLRSVQRHLRILERCGLIQYVERRRVRGRYSSYLYRILTKFGSEKNFSTTGHTRPVGSRFPNKDELNTYGTHPNETKAARKKREAERRREDYHWLFR
jgi:DNA-binding transcriptional ArsR family regulator